jgi:hypothetical protein
MPVSRSTRRRARQTSASLQPIPDPLVPPATAHSTVNSSQSSFSRNNLAMLPPEIRLRIFHWLLKNCIIPIFMFSSKRSSPGLHRSLSILLVSRQFYNECKCEVFRQMIGLPIDPYSPGVVYHGLPCITDLPESQLKAASLATNAMLFFKHLALTRRSLHQFIYTSATEKSLRAKMPHLQTVILWCGHRTQLLEDLPWGQLSELVAGSKWHGRCRYFDSQAENFPVYRHLTYLERMELREIRGDMRYFVENNRKDIDEGSLKFFIEFKTSPRKAARLQLLAGANVEIEMVKDTAKHMQAITGKALGHQAQWD